MDMGYLVIFFLIRLGFFKGLAFQPTHANIKYTHEIRTLACGFPQIEGKQDEKDNKFKISKHVVFHRSEFP